MVRYLRIDFLNKSLYLSYITYHGELVLKLIFQIHSERPLLHRNDILIFTGDALYQLVPFGEAEAALGGTWAL